MKYIFRILGPTALLQLAEKKDSLPSIKRPMYTQAMVGSVVVFTGFRKKDELVSFIYIKYTNLYLHYIYIIIFIFWPYRRDSSTWYIIWVVVSEKKWVQKWRILLLIVAVVISIDMLLYLEYLLCQWVGWLLSGVLEMTFPVMEIMKNW